MRVLRAAADDGTLLPHRSFGGGARQATQTRTAGNNNNNNNGTPCAHTHRTRRVTHLFLPESTSVVVFVLYSRYHLRRRRHRRHPYSPNSKTLTRSFSFVRSTPSLSVIPARHTCNRRPVSDGPSDVAKRSSGGYGLFCYGYFFFRHHRVTSRRLRDSTTTTAWNERAGRRDSDG